MNWMVRAVRGAALLAKKAAVRASATAPSMEKLSRVVLPVIAEEALPSTRTPKIFPSRSTTATMASSLLVAAAARWISCFTWPVVSVRGGSVARGIWLEMSAGAVRSSSGSTRGTTFARFPESLDFICISHSQPEARARPKAGPPLLAQRAERKGFLITKLHSEVDAMRPKIGRMESKCRLCGPSAAAKSIAGRHQVRGQSQVHLVSRSDHLAPVEKAVAGEGTQILRYLKTNIDIDFRDHGKGIVIKMAAIAG